MKLIWNEFAISVKDFIEHYRSSDIFPLPVKIECQDELKEWNLANEDVLLVSRLHSQTRVILRDTSSLKFYSVSINNPIEFYRLSPGKDFRADKFPESLKSILNHPESTPNNGHIDLNLTPEFKDKSAVRDDDRSDHMPASTFQFIGVYEAISLVGYHVGKDGDTLVDDRLLLIPAFTPVKLRVAKGAEEHPTQEELVRQMDSQFELPDEESTMTLTNEDFKFLMYKSKNSSQDFCFTLPEKVYSVINVGLSQGVNDQPQQGRKTSSTGIFGRIRKLSRGLSGKKEDASISKDSMSETALTISEVDVISSPILTPLDEGYESNRSTVFSQADDSVSQTNPSIKFSLEEGEKDEKEDEEKDKEEKEEEEEPPYQDLVDVVTKMKAVTPPKHTSRRLQPDPNRGELPALPVAPITKPETSAMKEEGPPSDGTYVNLEKFLKRQSMKEDVSQLTQFQVIEYLKRLKLDRHIERFLEEEIDGRFLKHMDKQTLMEMGFSNLEAVKLISFVEDGWKPTNNLVTLDDYETYKQLMMGNKKDVVVRL